MRLEPSVASSDWLGDEEQVVAQIHLLEAMFKKARDDAEANAPDSWADWQSPKPTANTSP